MPGLSLAQFVDTVTNTGPVFLSDDENIINCVSARSFIMGKFLRGSPASEVLQGGDKIQETLYLSANRTFQSIGINDDITWVNPQKDVLMQLDWRYAMDHMSWTEQEYILQTSNKTGAALKVKYKDMNYSKQQRMWDSVVAGFEGKLWQPPGTTSADSTMYNLMEGDSGSEFYSLPVFVHENAGSNGRFTSGWTNIEGLNPVTYGGASNTEGTGGNWDNYRNTYDFTDPLDNDGDATGIFDGFDDVSLGIGYQRPGFKDEYFEPDSHYTSGKAKKSHPNIIATSKAGMKLLMRCHRQSNQSLITPQDAAYPFPKWNEMAISDVAALDTAALYVAASGTGLVGERASTGTATTSVSKLGPRFYFFNTKYLRFIFHSQKYFKLQEARKLQEKLCTYVIPVEIWGNLTCTNRRMQGILSPA